MTHGFRQRLLLAALATGILAASRGFAADTAHPVVPGFERFYSGGSADAARGGQLLLGELNCVSCHLPAEKALGRKQAPVLDHVAGRVRISYLKRFLEDPQAVKPGTAMPNVFAADPERGQKVEALVQFLASTGSLKHERPDSKAVATGRDLYHKVGCVACHGSRDGYGRPDKVLATSMPLGDLKAKYAIGSLATFLENPHGVRPSGRMPKLLTAKESKDVANYLLQGIKVKLPQGRGATTFQYVEGSFDRVPDFAKLKPKESGTGPAFDLGLARRNDNFAFQFDGFFKIDQEAKFAFTLHSDDGSRLWVDGKLVVDNDGVHPPASQRGKVLLAKGVHKVTVGFFQAGGGAELAVQIEAPGFGSHDLAEMVAATEAGLDKKPAPPDPMDEDAIDIQPGLVDKGKAIFVSAGCASCHQLNAGNGPLASTLTAARLTKLKAEGGCLSPTPAKGLPWFALGNAQRAALAAAISTPPAPPKAPADVIAQSLTTFNCYACHVRDKVGGPEDELNKFFKTVQPEMGDEGRIPPWLNGVGAKLNVDYFHQILDKGSHDRPYMHTRMPGFGDANVGHLVEAFAAIDSIAKAPAVQFDLAVPRVKATARHLVGGQAFGCVKCHTFNGVKAEGVQGIDMTLLPKRLKHDWFHAYVEDPQRLRPGTRMPASFDKGKSVLPEILDGKPATQIEAIWVYLSDGAKAQLPAGMGKNPIPLVPTTSAIIYRNFIEDSGMKLPRAIAVGYPEKANLAFDANDIRLALLWQGAFIDAGKHWTDRGEGYQTPLGDNILHLHAGVPFAILAKPEEAWPTTPAKAQGYRFLGYRLTSDDRPTFLYSLGDVKVEDFPNPVVGKEVSLRRTLRLTATQAIDNLHFRAAVGTKIEALGDGWYRIDGTWKMKVEGGVIRQPPGKAELLVPVRFTDGKAQVVQEYVW
jgi:mono/diheme cytochrome c family protein